MTAKKDTTPAPEPEPEPGLVANEPVADEPVADEPVADPFAGRTDPAPVSEN